MASTPAAHRIGIVPIVFRGSEHSAQSIVAAVAGLGFQGIQSIDAADPVTLAATLDTHDMGVAEVYAALPASTAGPTEEAREVGRERLRLLDDLDGDVLVAALDGTRDRDVRAGRASDGATPRLTEEGVARLAELLEELAAEAGRRGRRLAFHPHVGTYVETSDEVDRLMAAADPDAVGLCLDVGHDLLGGGDPVLAIHRHGARLIHVHLKDVAPAVLDATRSGRTKSFTDAVDQVVFCPLGDGVLPLDGVLAALDAVGYSGWLMIEQDSSAGDPVVDSRRSLEHLRERLAARRKTTT